MPIHTHTHHTPLDTQASLQALQEENSALHEDLMAVRGIMQHH